ncbi:ribosomal protein S6 kinase alpha-5 [Eupeodes corollae]|uniref:ribosomal protein S6 kinase alpha-5 n=1 Tax=Eupeodes corollae TaxID=290404 RepID=UPI00248FF919|nr:ribosomal protein S6 kinase alpha-5 [Eupeodes corollae]XP_055909093.1 ribosomal protein S6 kinase alpha-5 [Eupeodes corollae]
MSRQYNSTRTGATVAYANVSNVKKMASRRQPDHESGYYEDNPVLDFARINGSDDSQPSKPPSSAKRQKLSSDDDEKQNRHHGGGGGGGGSRQTQNKKLKKQQSESITTTTNVNDSNIYQQMTNNNNKKRQPTANNKRHLNNNNNNIKHCDVVPQHHKNITDHGNQKKQQQQFTTSSSTASEMTVTATKVKSTPTTTPQRTNGTSAAIIQMNDEIVEVNDSESEEEAVMKKNATKKGQNHNHHQQHAQISGGGSAAGTDDTSNGSNNNKQQSNHQADDRGDSGSEVECVAVTDAQTNADNEQLQREIEEVTTVHSKCTASEEEKVNLSHFQLIRVLGTGAYGKVFLVRKKGGHDHRKLYAMKVLRKATVVQKKKTAEHTTTERQVLEAIQQSPFLVGMHYAFQTDSKLFLILDYVNGGELFTHLYKSEHFPEDDVRIYIAEVILALEHLHKLGIIYRDIKLENILLDGNGHIVLADFGLSKIFKPDSNQRAHSFCGTLEYMAPEIIRPCPAGHDLAVDWWSVGVLTYELLTGASPFTVVEQRNTQNDISRRIQKSDPPLPSSLGEIVKDFILKMLHKDPKKRLGGNNKSADEIKRHPFFNGINWQDLKRKRRKAPFKPRITCEDDTGNFSEEFTKLPVVDSPAPVPPNTNRLFRGYSYVAPQHLQKKTSNSRQLIEEEFCNPPLKNPPPLTDFKLDQCSYSSGSFGTCYIASHPKNKRNYSAKVIPLAKYRPAEVDALIACRGHSGILDYINTYRSGSNIVLITEFVSGCELFHHIDEEDGLSEINACDVFQRISEAVRHIHSKNFIHGDLKPENVVYSDPQMRSIKLIDFGSASYNSRGLVWKDTPRYTLDYAPPEALRSSEIAIYSKAFDIWSLGATLYTMVIGHAPFRHGKNDRTTNEAVIRERILNGDMWTTKNPRWLATSLEFRNLVTSCMQIENSKRLTVGEVLKHPWMTMKHSTNGVRSDKANKEDEEEVVLVENDDDDEEEEDEADMPAEDAAKDTKRWSKTSSICSVHGSESNQSLQRSNGCNESEGDTTSGLGRSKSSDQENTSADQLHTPHLEGLGGCDVLVKQDDQLDYSPTNNNDVILPMHEKSTKQSFKSPSKPARNSKTQKTTPRRRRTRRNCTKPSIVNVLNQRFDAFKRDESDSEELNGFVADGKDKLCEILIRRRYWKMLNALIYSNQCQLKHFNIDRKYKALEDEPTQDENDNDDENSGQFPKPPPRVPKIKKEAASRKPSAMMTRSQRQRFVFE